MRVPFALTVWVFTALGWTCLLSGCCQKSPEVKATYPDSSKNPAEAALKGLAAYQSLYGGDLINVKLKLGDPIPEYSIPKEEFLTSDTKIIKEYQKQTRRIHFPVESGIKYRGEIVVGLQDDIWVMEECKGPRLMKQASHMPSYVFGCGQIMSSPFLLKIEETPLEFLVVQYHENTFLYPTSDLPKAELVRNKVEMAIRIWPKLIEYVKNDDCK
jgi:hypothetical protein